jgi:hypothetical protein
MKISTLRLFHLLRRWNRCSVVKKTQKSLIFEEVFLSSLQKAKLFDNPRLSKNLWFFEGEGF